ncbi:hypothetical protein CWM52_05075 [Raoultella sp. T31]|nr:hypothetical protein CWM52_05075 [Raoultella sp. T31]
MRSFFIWLIPLLLPLLAILQSGGGYNRPTPRTDRPLTVMLMVPARHILVQISTGPQDQVYSLNPKDGNSPLDWYALQPPGYGGRHA